MQLGELRRRIPKGLLGIDGVDVRGFVFPNLRFTAPIANMTLDTTKKRRLTPRGVIALIRGGDQNWILAEMRNISDRRNDHLIPRSALQRYNPIILHEIVRLGRTPMHPRPKLPRRTGPGHRLKPFGVIQKTKTLEKLHSITTVGIAQEGTPWKGLRESPKGSIHGHAAGHHTPKENEETVNRNKTKRHGYATKRNAVKAPRHVCGRSTRRTTPNIANNEQ